MQGTRLIDRYRIDRKLGEGGMGVVYAAHDERLDRAVAIKMIRGTEASDQARERLWREARAAAAISHPNVCQLYEIGEDEGRLFIAMELLEGASLATTLESGPLSVRDALPIVLSVLAALEAVHRRDLIHRDLKPSNIFVTDHGVKLLDFGLARAVLGDASATEAGLTMPGSLVGTPAYMAPEQLLGQPCDARADLFAVGTLLFEMLSGKSPFAADSVAATIHAVMYERPPALTGSTSIDAIDRIIRRALEKRPADRYATAGAMADDIRSTLLISDTNEVARAHAVTRLVVLPFKMLRPDPDTDFLAFGLADAITASLSGLESLVVRSSLAAARFATDALDLKALVTEIDVDAVLTGTLMRAGTQLRVGAQLLEAPQGTVLWSQTSQVPMGDLFELQDELSRRIVESLSIPLTLREQQLLHHDVPASPRAYEFYLRANQLAHASATWETARDLYLQCLAEDPDYAPAWARLGRVYRLLLNYSDPTEAGAYLEKAEGAFRRALELHPDLPVAHNLYAYLEVDLGRAPEAMVRLIGCARRSGADPELFAGLVHACRYCGLLEASVAAYERARHLDPNIRTSVPLSYWMLGDLARATETDVEAPSLMSAMALLAEGRTAEVVAQVREAEQQSQGMERAFVAAFRAAIEGNRSDFLTAFEALADFVRDPEGLYIRALMAAHIGESDLALEHLQRAVDGGFVCHAAMVREPWFDPVRSAPGFPEILRQAEARHRAAVRAFNEAGGARLLGLRTVD